MTPPPATTSTAPTLRRPQHLLSVPSKEQVSPPPVLSPEQLMLLNRHQSWLQTPVSQQLLRHLLKQKETLLQRLATKCVSENPNASEILALGSQLNQLLETIKVTHDSEIFVQRIA